MRETVGWARELLGGNGIVLDYNVARFFADAEALYSYEGTREMNTLIVGRAMTGACPPSFVGDGDDYRTPFRGYQGARHGELHRRRRGRPRCCRTSGPR